MPYQAGGITRSPARAMSSQEVRKMYRRTNAALRPGGSARLRLGWLGLRSVLTAILLAAGSLIGVAVTTLVASAPAQADAVPPAPAGWTTVFGDDFAGPAGSAPSAA